MARNNKKRNQGISDEQLRRACDKFLAKRETGHVSFRDQISKDAKRERERRLRRDKNKQDKLDRIADRIERESRGE